MQEQHPAKHIDQRRDEIAQAGFHNVTSVYCPYIHGPVGADQQGRDEQDSAVMTAFNFGEQTGPVFSPGDDNNKENKRPEHPVRNDFIRGDVMQHFPVNRVQTPKDISAKSVSNTAIHR